MGLAALAASGTASTAATAFQVLTLNFTGAGLTVAAHFLMNFLGTPIFMLLLGLLIPGLTIAFVLPMIPWVMWMAGVMGWLILVCEAVIAVPLWMLAHMTMQGEGLHGRANEGYAPAFQRAVPADADGLRPVPRLLRLRHHILLIRQTFGIAAGFRARARLDRHQRPRRRGAAVDLRDDPCGRSADVVPDDLAGPASRARDCLASTAPAGWIWTNSAEMRPSSGLVAR